MQLGNLINPLLRQSMNLLYIVHTVNLINRVNNLRSLIMLHRHFAILQSQSINKIGHCL